MQIKELDEIKSLLNSYANKTLEPHQVDRMMVLLEKSRDQLGKVQRRQDKSLTTQQRLRKWTKHYSRLGEAKGLLLFFHPVVIVWASLCMLYFLLSGEQPSIARFQLGSSGWPLILIYHIPCIFLAFRLKKNPPMAFVWLAGIASVLLTIAFTVWALGLSESPFRLYHNNSLMQYAILMMLAVMNAAQAIWLVFAIRAIREQHKCQ